MSKRKMVGLSISYFIIFLFFQDYKTGIAFDAVSGAQYDSAKMLMFRKLLLNNSRIVSSRCNDDDGLGIYTEGGGTPNPKPNNSNSKNDSGSNGNGSSGSNSNNNDANDNNSNNNGNNGGNNNANGNNNNDNNNNNNGNNTNNNGGNNNDINGSGMISFSYTFYAMNTTIDFCNPQDIYSYNKVLLYTISNHILQASKSSVIGISSTVFIGSQTQTQTMTSSKHIEYKTNRKLLENLQSEMITNTVVVRSLAIYQQREEKNLFQSTGNGKLEEKIRLSSVKLDLNALDGIVVCQSDNATICMASRVSTTTLDQCAMHPSQWSSLYYKKRSFSGYVVWLAFIIMLWMFLFAIAAGSIIFCHINLWPSLRMFTSKSNGKALEAVKFKEGCSVALLSVFRIAYIALIISYTYNLRAINFACVELSINQSGSDPQYSSPLLSILDCIFYPLFLLGMVLRQEWHFCELNHTGNFVHLQHKRNILFCSYFRQGLKVIATVSVLSLIILFLVIISNSNVPPSNALSTLRKVFQIVFPLIVILTQCFHWKVLKDLNAIHRVKVIPIDVEGGHTAAERYFTELSARQFPIVTDKVTWIAVMVTCYFFLLTSIPAILKNYFSAFLSYSVVTRLLEVITVSLFLSPFNVQNSSLRKKLAAKIKETNSLCHSIDESIAGTRFLGHIRYSGRKRFEKCAKYLEIMDDDNSPPLFDKDFQDDSPAIIHGTNQGLQENNINLRGNKDEKESLIENELKEEGGETWVDRWAKGILLSASTKEKLNTAVSKAKHENSYVSNMTVSVHSESKAIEAEHLIPALPVCHSNIAISVQSDSHMMKSNHSVEKVLSVWMSPLQTDMDVKEAPNMDPTMHHEEEKGIINCSPPSPLTVTTNSKQLAIPPEMPKKPVLKNDATVLSPIEGPDSPSHFKLKRRFGKLPDDSPTPKSAVNEIEN